MYANPNTRNGCLIIAWTVNLILHRDRRPPCWLMVIATVGNCRPPVQMWRFRAVTPGWIDQWLWNYAKSWCSIKGVSCCFIKVICQILRSRGTKYHRFWPELGVPDCNSSMNWPMTIEWCTKLEEALKRCPIVFKVIRQISVHKHHRFWPKLDVSRL